MEKAHEVTVLLDLVRSGDKDAADQLVGLLYDDLRAMARARLVGQRPNFTLQPTDVVHEAYARLMAPGAQTPENRRHFFGVAAKAMRSVVVDHIRATMREKRPGAWGRVSLSDVVAVATDTGVDLLALDEALTRLEAANARRARLVTLKFFAGMTIPEIASDLGVAEATVKREWEAARVWLYRDLAHARTPTNA